MAFEGTVTEFVWRNPHVYVLVETVNPVGEAVEWELQMGPTNVISRRGWRRDTLQPGDRVSVRAHAALSGRPYGTVQSIDKDGGLGLVQATGAAPASATAATLEGKWIAARSETMSYPGGFDGFFNALMTLNEKGRAAQAAYDPLSDENPEASCVGRPTPAALVSTSLYLMEMDIRESEEIVSIRSEYFDEERTVYMDGREHPGPAERFVTGHSIGWWEGTPWSWIPETSRTIVLLTGSVCRRAVQKHVVERYSLNEDGAHIDLEFTLEDPEYLAEPMVHRSS